MSWLLDTNVLSEMRKGFGADERVRVWAAGTAKDRHFISVLSLGEIRRGIELLRKKSPSQCPAFERWLTQIQTDYASAILPVSEEVAERWGHLTAIRTLPVVDGLIAATASVYGLTVVTRNTKDFAPSGVRTVNPYK